MKAILFESKDAPVKVAEVGLPLATPGMALVRVRAAALNHRDVWILKGQYAGLRYPLIPGSDAAGVVESVGVGVDGNWVGREVIINPSHLWGANEAVQSSDYKILGLPDNGTMAEVVAVPARYLFDKPFHLTFEQASALPLAGLTAFRALFSRCRVQPGEKVLITGIGGGVALFALQFAVASGVEAWVTSGSEVKIQVAKTMGAQGGVLYSQLDWRKTLQAAAGGFDVIIDGAGGPEFGELLNLANPGARIAIYGGTAGSMEGLSPQKIFWKQVSILGSTMGSEADFYNMLRFVESKGIVPVVDEVISLDEAARAFDKMTLGKQIGKIVLSF
jgi:NADPH:quinone reductase-like Zn-dependent oxidoreductase